MAQDPSTYDLVPAEFSQAARIAPPELQLESLHSDEARVLSDASPKAARLSMRWAPLVVLLGVSVTALIMLGLTFGQSQPDRMPASAQQSIQDEAQIRCHVGCEDRDHANMQCLKDCLPAKEQCMAARCDGADLGSVEFTSCAIDCHTTECAAGCAGIGAIATRCHSNCEPERDALLDKACIHQCRQWYDNSCMDGCKDAKSECTKSKCTHMSGAALKDCHYQCTLESCGAECQDAAEAFSTCSSHCRQDKAGHKPKMFVPAFTQSPVSRNHSCSDQCRQYDHRHIQCLRICGPNIGSCMQMACPNSRQGTSEQAQCQSECESDACGASCHKTSEEVELCYKECTPTDTSTCSRDCHQKYDSSCMKGCSQTMGNCLVEQCADLLGKDEQGFDRCQQQCMETHCGKDCAHIAVQFQQCAGKCAEAIAAIEMK